MYQAPTTQQSTPSVRKLKVSNVSKIRRTATTKKIDNDHHHMNGKGDLSGIEDDEHLY